MRLQVLRSQALGLVGLIFLLTSIITVGGCSQVSKKGTSPGATGQSANKLFQDARASLNANDFEKAIKQYETLEAQYPLGRYAQQALLEQAYAYYKFDEPDSALDTIDRYMQTFPKSPKVDYALYLRGLVNFNRGGSVIDKVFPRSFSDLDNVRRKEAFQDFATLLNRYPNSSYAPDARKRMKFLRNSLGEGEVNVAKYYYLRGAYLAAFNRAEYAIKHHQGSPAIISALEIKLCAAQKLGKKQLAQDTLRVLQLNFPDKKTVSCPSS